MLPDDPTPLVWRNKVSHTYLSHCPFEQYVTCTGLFLCRLWNSLSFLGLGLATVLHLKCGGQCEGGGL